MGQRYTEKFVNRVFVYGSLMRGFALHDIYAYDASTVEECYTDGLLFDLGDYPALVAGEGIVYGELMEFSDIDKILMRFDELEGYNGEGYLNFFERVMVNVTLLNCGSKISAWTYVYAGDVEDKNCIEEGDWKEYYHYKEFYDLKSSYNKRAD